jgi:hypothetical protein
VGNKVLGPGSELACDTHSKGISGSEISERNFAWMIIQRKFVMQSTRAKLTFCQNISFQGQNYLSEGYGKIGFSMIKYIIFMY